MQKIKTGQNMRLIHRKKLKMNAFESARCALSEYGVKPSELARKCLKMTKKRIQKKIDFFCIF